MSGRWVDRYRDGDREQVWRELRQLGAEVRSPEHSADARAVCDEMAQRARFNVETLVARLTLQGFLFRSNDDQSETLIPHQPPGAGVDVLLTELEARWGPVSLVMSSWMRIVGDVWLVGTHPDWEESDAADPLVIELEGSRYPDDSMLDYWASEYEAWDEMRSTDPSTGEFVLPVAPDRLHKANVSGGAPYGFQLPDSCADGIFVWERRGSLVSYLNEAFKHGGFPGPVSGPNASEIRRALADGLLEL